MAVSAKQIVARLEEIKGRASQMAANGEPSASLVEEAADLGLQLAALHDKKGK